jgi:hypothetical protein
MWDDASDDIARDHPGRQENGMNESKATLPNQRRFRLYAKRLAEKGWGADDICKRARIRSERWPRLSEGLMKPQIRELSRLRGLMRLPVPGREMEARDVWKKKEGWPRVSPEEQALARPTVKGLDMLMDVQAHQGERGYPIERQGEKVIARKLVKDFLLEKIGDGGTRVRITDMGRHAIREFTP